MEIVINGVYKMSDDTTIICIDKGVKYWIGVEAKPLKGNKVILDFSTAKIYEIGNEEQGYMLEEIREIEEDK